MSVLGKRIIAIPNYGFSQTYILNYIQAKSETKPKPQ